MNLWRTETKISLVKETTEQTLAGRDCCRGEGDSKVIRTYFQRFMRGPRAILEMRNCIRSKYAPWLLSPSTFTLSKWQQKHMSMKENSKDGSVPPSFKLPKGKLWVIPTRYNSHLPTPFHATQTTSGYQNSLQWQGNRDSQIQRWTDDWKSHGSGKTPPWKTGTNNKRTQCQKIRGTITKRRNFKIRTTGNCKESREDKENNQRSEMFKMFQKVKLAKGLNKRR